MDKAWRSLNYQGMEVVELSRWIRHGGGWVIMVGKAWRWLSYQGGQGMEVVDLLRWVRHGGG